MIAGCLKVCTNCFGHQAYISNRDRGVVELETVSVRAFSDRTMSRLSSANRSANVKKRVSPLLCRSQTRRRHGTL